MKKLSLPLLLLLAACSTPKEKSGSEQMAIKVKTVKVKQSATSQALTFSGTVIPYQSIPVGFQTTGTVQKVLVDEGMAVRKGQLLATLDKTDLMNMFTLSEAKYKQALDAYNRLKEVHDKGSLTDIKWVEMETNLQQAESSMNIAKNNLEKANLTAPESGWIGRRNVEPGMSAISINTPFEIVKIDRVYIRLSVPENEIAKIKQGMAATFSIPAIDNQQFSGEVSIVGVVADQFSRTYEVKILANNPDNLMKPGMIGDVTLEGDQTSANVIDYLAVTRDSKGTFVYKVDGSRTSVAKQPVKTGHISSEGIEIIEGLKVGDEVVCEGLEKISENSKIEL
jgi:RND family efflux transporter MFP subunit